MIRIVRGLPVRVVGRRWFWTKGTESTLIQVPFTIRNFGELDRVKAWNRQRSSEPVAAMDDNGRISGFPHG